MRRRPWNEEADAAWVIMSFLGGTTHQVDSGGGAHELHDFDVVPPDGDTIAVEVTRYNVPETLGVLAEVSKRQWAVAELANVWVVSMTPRL